MRSLPQRSERDLLLQRASSELGLYLFELGEKHGLTHAELILAIQRAQTQFIVEMYRNDPD